MPGARHALERQARHGTVAPAERRELRQARLLVAVGVEDLGDAREEAPVVLSLDAVRQGPDVDGDPQFAQRLGDSLAAEVVKVIDRSRDDDQGAAGWGPGIVVHGRPRLSRRSGWSPHP